MCIDEGCTLESLYLYLEFGFAINLLFLCGLRVYVTLTDRTPTSLVSARRARSPKRLGRSSRREPHDQHDNRNRKRGIETEDPLDRFDVALQFSYVPLIVSNAR